MDKKLHKVCDRCDHEMSNQMFSEKLISDFKAQNQVLKLEKSKVDKYELKLKSL